MDIRDFVSGVIIVLFLTGAFLVARGKNAPKGVRIVFSCGFLAIALLVLYFWISFHPLN